MLLLGLRLGWRLHYHLSLSSCGTTLVLYSSRLFFLDGYSRLSYVEISFIAALNWESKERKKGKKGKKVKSNRWLK